METRDIPAMDGIREWFGLLCTDFLFNGTFADRIAPVDGFVAVASIPMPCDQPFRYPAAHSPVLYVCRPIDENLDVINALAAPDGFTKHNAFYSGRGIGSRCSCKVCSGKSFDGRETWGWYTEGIYVMTLNERGEKRTRLGQ